MSTDGGVVIYGVEEDTAAKTFTATPFSLVGFKERISQVVDTRIREHIDFAVYELQLDTDPTQGFAVVVVPPSLRGRTRRRRRADTTEGSPAETACWGRPRLRGSTSVDSVPRNRHRGHSTKPLPTGPSKRPLTEGISTSSPCHWFRIPACANGLWPVRASLNWSRMCSGQNGQSASALPRARISAT